MAFEYKKGGSLTSSLFSTPFFSLSLSLSWEGGGTKHFPSSSSSFLLLVSQGDRWRHPLRGKERRGGPTLLRPSRLLFPRKKEEKSPLLPSGEIVVPLFGGGRIPILKLISPPFSLLVCRKTHFQEKRRRRRSDPTNSPPPPPPILLLLFLLLEISRQPIY